MSSQINLYMNNVKEATTIVVAVSTGIDSMVLLSLLERTNHSLIVAHVNHNKREQSKLEEQFIKEYCTNKGIPCEVLVLNEVEGNFQAEARKLRYEFFTNIATKYNAEYIATAHHLDDTVENTMMRITKGSYFKSLTGIRDLGTNVRIIRPLQYVTKDIITDYANNNDIKYYEDSSNLGDEYQRNRFRNKIIPLLKEENSNFVNAISSLSNDITDIVDLFDSLVVNVFDGKEVLLDKFMLLHKVLKKYVLYTLLEGYANSGLINEILISLDKNTNNKVFNLGSKQIVVEYNRLYVKEYSNTNIEELEITNTGVYNFGDKYKIIVTKNTTKNWDKMCYNKKELLFTIRTFKSGDTIELGFGHKKVSRIFIDKKISKEKRNEVPIILDNMNEIIKVGNYCTSSKYNDDYLIEIMED